MKRIEKVKPTPEQVQQEIETLTAQLATVRPMSAFGNDNVAVIKAQIEVAQENLDDDDIYKRFGEYDDPDDTSDPINFEEISSILDMRHWLDGESTDGTPSDNWAPLCSSEGKLG